MNAFLVFLVFSSSAAFGVEEACFAFFLSNRKPNQLRSQIAKQPELPVVRTEKNIIEPSDTSALTLQPGQKELFTGKEQEENLSAPYYSGGDVNYAARGSNNVEAEKVNYLPNDLRNHSNRE